MTIETSFSRRHFITGTLAASAAAALGLAGCAPQGTPTAATGGDEPAAGAAAGNAPAESAPASDVPAWLGEAPAITDADCAETVDCEVLVIGAGCSGLVAANFAAMEGAKTLLIEKFDKGTGLRGSAIGAVGSRKQQEAGVNIDPQEICNDLVHYSLNNASMDLYQLWAAHSAEAVNWYCDLTDGVDQCKIDLEWSMPAEETRYKCWPTGHGAMLDNGKAGKDEASGEGVTYAQVEANFLAQPNAELRYLTSLECLIKEGDKVVGAYASTDEGATFLRINAAKGVIVATGGYANNPDMYMALQAENAKGLCGVVPFGNFNAQGQGIKACLWAGAVKDENPTSMVFDRGIMRPDQLPGAPFDMDFGYFHMATQPFLKVDIEGERITNESSPYDFLIHALARKSSQRAWFDIWDSNWPTDIQRFHTIGCSGLIKGEGTNQMDPEGVEGPAAIIDALVEEGKIVKADTLEEIADARAADRTALIVAGHLYDDEALGELERVVERISSENLVEAMEELDRRLDALTPDAPERERAALAEDSLVALAPVIACFDTANWLRPPTDREQFLDEIAFADYNEAQQDVYGRIERGIEAVMAERAQREKAAAAPSQVIHEPLDPDVTS